MIIAISGTPGTGKHTVAEQVSKITGYKVLDLGKLLSKSDGEKEVSLKQLNSAFQNIKKENSLVVSHLSHLIDSKSIKITIVLRTDPLILIKRLKKRGYSSSKIYDNAMFEALDGTYLEAILKKRKTFQIDNSGDLGEAVKKVVKIIKGKGRGDKVDFSPEVLKVEGFAGK